MIQVHNEDCIIQQNFDQFQQQNKKNTIRPLSQNQQRMKNQIVLNSIQPTSTLNMNNIISYQQPLIVSRTFEFKQPDKQIPSKNSKNLLLNQNPTVLYKSFTIRRKETALQVISLNKEDNIKFNQNLNTIQRKNSFDKLEINDLQSGYTDKYSYQRSLQKCNFSTNNVSGQYYAEKPLIQIKQLDNIEQDQITLRLQLTQQNNLRKYLIDQNAHQPIGVQSQQKWCQAANFYCNQNILSKYEHNPKKRCASANQLSYTYKRVNNTPSRLEENILKIRQKQYTTPTLNKSQQIQNALQNTKVCQQCKQKISVGKRIKQKQSDYVCVLCGQYL